MTPRDEQTVENRMKSLTLSSTTEDVADSWEDQVSDGDDNDNKPSEIRFEDAERVSQKPAAIFPTTPRETSPDPSPKPPPPTPSTPRTTTPTTQPLYLPNGTSAPIDPTRSSSSPRLRDASSSSSPAARPAKTNAVASRLIAGALGVKAPRRTEEQRAYDRAVKEGEVKRRAREKEEEGKKKADLEKARRGVWEE